MIKNKLLMQANELTSARFDAKSSQLDILFMLLASIDTKDEINKEYFINVKDITLITGRKHNYSKLREEIGNLVGKLFEIENTETLKQITLFREVTYYKGTGILGIIINESARHLFFNLKEEFTWIPLKPVLTLKSKYAKRLYTIALQWKRRGYNEYTLEEFKYMLGCENQYNTISQFKEKVLDQARNEINNLKDAGIQFDYELIKNGRAYEKIRITLHSTKKLLQKEKEIDINTPIKKQIKEAKYEQRLKEILHLGINENFAIILAKNDVNYTEYQNAKLQAETDLKNGKCTDWLKWMIGILQKRGILPKD